MSSSDLTGEAIELDSLTAEGSILQTPYWGRFKERFGWRATAVLIECSDERWRTRMLALTRRFPLGFRLTYVPHGPTPGTNVDGDSDNSPDGVIDVSRRLPEIAHQVAAAVPGGTDLVRFDLPFERFADAPDRLLESIPGIRRSRTHVQPPDTVIIDLTPDEEAILGQMKSKTRYNIRLAAKRGVKIRTAGAEGVDTWYELYRITAERDGITIHSRAYYRELFAMPPDDGSVELVLLFAEVEDEVVAGNIVAVCGTTGYYLYGASSNRHRNLMPTYLLQWEGMRFCRLHGCTRYDLWGIPPSDDPDHPMHGLYRMKTGFGGRIVHRTGAWDVDISPVRARVFRAGEAIRLSYFAGFRKRITSRR